MIKTWIKPIEGNRNVLYLKGLKTFGMLKNRFIKFIKVTWTKNKPAALEGQPKRIRNISLEIRIKQDDLSRKFRLLCDILRWNIGKLRSIKSYWFDSCKVDAYKKNRYAHIERHPLYTL